MSFRLDIDLRGIKDLKKRLAKLAEAEVEVGFFPESKYGPENGNLHVAAVAWMQQKGANEYPARPFFDNTVEDRRTISMLAYKMRMVALEAISKRGSLREVLKGAGNFLAEEVRFAIDDYPGSNSDRTIKAKGFNDPLRHTSKMMNSVKVKIV